MSSAASSSIPLCSINPLPDSGQGKQVPIRLRTVQAFVAAQAQNFKPLPGFSA
jgi:hypothetical protein